MCRHSMRMSLFAALAVFAAMPLYAALTVSGTVVRSDGSPLPSTTVRLYFSNNADLFTPGTPKAETLTDENGSYTFTQTTRGYYRVEFTYGSFYQVYSYQPSFDLATTIDYHMGTPLVQTVEANASLPICRVSGTVTGPNGAALLSPIPVQVYRTYMPENEVHVLKGETISDGNGQYLIDGLPEGGFWEVVFGVGWDSQNYYVPIQQPYNVMASANLELNISLDRVGISGVVTGPDGVTPLPGIEVKAWLLDGSAGTTTITDAAGRYTLEERYAGWYGVEFLDPSGDHLPEFYDDASDLNSCSVIEIAHDGDGVTGINASLASSVPPVAAISGTVTGPNGTLPLPGIEATAFRWAGTGWSQIATTATAADGRYTLAGVPPGTYCMLFTDQSNGAYAREVYAGASDLISGTAFVVPAATSVSGIGASLETASWISGTVTTPDGLLPLGGIEVAAYRRCDTGEGYVLIRSSVTGTNGNYAIGGLPSGTYRVLFADWQDGDYVRAPYGLAQAPQSAAGGTSTLGGAAKTVLRVSATDIQEDVLAASGYDGALDLEAGSDIVLPGNATIADVDASLATAAKISGTVTGPGGSTPLQGIDAVAYRWSAAGGAWEWMGAAVTDANGAYAIGGLPAGTYRVQFSDGQKGDHAGEVYDGASGLSSGSDIVVLAATNVVGIHASLATTSKIAGTVTGPGGVTPLPDIDAEAFRQNDSGGGWQWMSKARTDGNGHYTISGLPAGTYRVRFRDALLGAYLAEYYDGALELAYGTDITVNAGATTNGINASLAAAGAAIPEIDVQGNAVSIADGDDTPSVADHTDFGSTRATGGVVVRTFFIKNAGNAPLALTGSPRVAVSGAHAADFTVTTQPAISTAPGGSTTFQVTFDPLAAGLRTATLTIANDDGNENPCSFAVQGKGVIPPGILTPLSDSDDICVVRWTSIADHIYTLHQSTNLTQGFTLLQAGILATPPLNTYTDHVNKATSKFWKVTAE